VGGGGGTEEESGAVLLRMEGRGGRWPPGRRPAAKREID
jgi:hypothetical protein